MHAYINQPANVLLFFDLSKFFCIFLAKKCYFTQKR